MRCPSCMFENPEEMKFCGRCGSKLAEPCSQCGFQSPPGFQFCGECGASVKPASLTAAGPSSEAERRQLTVMFCDLVGSTPLSERLDPEDLREVVQAYQEACAGVIVGFGGHIAQLQGDGLLVYFGYPQAHEDDPQRAVRAALGIVGELPQLNLRLQPKLGVLRAWPLQVRIGIHTGLVVAGEMGAGGKRELLVMGETPNIAARIQGIAEPDTVAIGPATHRLIEGWFDCRSLGAHALKGVSTPVTVYRVLGESGAQSRFEVAASRGLIPLVGRDKEAGLLVERWEQVRDGLGQVVLLSGEAGIGKSRLVQALRERLAGEPHAWLECRCSSYHRNSALYPVIDLLQRLFAFDSQDSPAEKLRKLERSLEPSGFAGGEVVPLLASMLSLPPPAGHSPLTLTPQRQRQKTLEAVLALLLQVAEQQPTLLVMEDLHWADPSTLELLGLLLGQVPTARLLALLIFRPDFTPPWPTHSYVAPLALTRLSPQQTERMIARVAGGKALPAEVLRQLVEKTDGVPLFVEELTRMVLESGRLREQEGRYELTGPLTALSIPATLHDSLMARLDRLSPLREVAQLGATLGREFSFALIQAVWATDEGRLRQGLTDLVAAEVLYQRGLPPQARYLFKHALIQDAAYQSMLKSKRQQVHHQVAQVLEKRFPETVETQPELLGHHYTEAGLAAQAVSYWHKAGQRAAQRSAYVEAVGHLAKGLGLVDGLPDSPDRFQQELMLQTTLGTTLVVTRGYAAPEVKQAYGRALALCRQAGETPQIFPVLFGLWRFYLLSGELQTARELAEQLMRLAQSIRDPALLLWAHATLGVTLVHFGELTPALTHLEQSIGIYDPQRDRPDRSPMSATTQDPKVTCLSYAAWALWSLGYPDQARKRIDEALALSRELSHPFSRAFALHFAALFHQLLREVETVQERAEALMALSHEQGFPYFLAEGAIQQGWALARQGQAEAGIARMRQGMATVQAMGAELVRLRFLALLAEAYREAGQPGEGLGLLAGALVEVQKTGERFYEAELRRLKGELWLESAIVGPASGERGFAEAEACFQQALDIARRQSAKSLELRAAIRLSRLWQGQGRREEARQMLAEIYGWFTEGFDTADSQEARALLEELT